MLKVKLINEKTPLKIKMVAKFPSVVLANLQDKETTPTKETQVVVADKTYDGLSKVTVNPIPDEYIIPSGEIEFTQNGTYDVTDKASAKVNIKEKVLGTKTITTNGTYNASDDNLDGYSEVEVNISKYAPRSISFYNYKGTELDYEINNLDTSNVTNMSQMFYDCKKLTSLDLSNFDTSKVTRLDYMFCYCEKLTSLDLSNFDTSNVINITSMFSNCSNLETIKINSFDTSKVTSLNNTFNNCFKLDTIPQLNGNAINSLSSSFFNCKNLTNFNGITNLGQAYSTSQSANYSNYKLVLSSSTKLTEQSLINILNNLYDIKTKGVKPQQVILGATNLAKLVSEEGQQALANSQLKGWNIS